MHLTALASARRARAILILLAVACATMPGVPGEAAAQATATGDPTVDAVFDAIQRRLIEDFFGRRAQDAYNYRDDDEFRGKHGKDLPPGLAKKDHLPPGLAKQLARNGTLPPGLAKRDLPYELESRLEPLPPGRRRVIVDGDVLLIDVATNVILDILYGVAADSAN